MTSRLGGRILGPWGIFDCADGKILLACVEEAQWQRLVELMGNPAWAQEEIFKNRLSRGRNSDALSLLIGAHKKTGCPPIGREEAVARFSVIRARYR